MPRAYRSSQDYDVSKASHYSFPATSYFEEITDGSGTVIGMEIWGTGAPGSDHNNAPLNAIYHDRTNQTMHYKDAAGANWSAFDQTT